nr:MAG TPA: hypothetical protein [Caudoviricetes sp.]
MQWFKLRLSLTATPLRSSSMESENSFLKPILRRNGSKR